MNDLSKIKKQDIVDFVKKNYNDNYVVVYKRTGDDPNAIKVTKPQITPVSVNRDSKSEFLASVLEKEVNDIEPRFVNFSSDLKSDLINQVPLIYKQNEENERFQLTYVLDFGTDNDKRLKLAVDYLKFLGTNKISASEKLEQFYKLGCDLKVTSDSKSTKINLSGLSSNLDQSLSLLEDILSNAVGDDNALANLKLNYEKQKRDAKLNKQTILFSAMTSFARYGSNSSFTNMLSNEELKNISSEELIDLIKSLTKKEHRILFYGSEKIEEIKSYFKIS